MCLRYWLTDTIDAVWAESHERRHVWVASHKDTLLNHLIHCSQAPPDVQESARLEKRGSPPSIQHPAAISTDSTVSGGQVMSHQIPAGESSFNSLHTSVQSHPTLHHDISGSHSPLTTPGSSMPGTNPPTPLWPLASVQPRNFGLIPGFSRGESEAPSLHSTSSSRSASPAVPRKRTLSHRSSLGVPEWSRSMQEQFEQSITRITASANLPFSWVENEHLERFVTTFVHPDAKLPSRKSLTTKLIPNELSVFRDTVQRKVLNSEVTASCDGWTGANYHHYVAFAMTTRKEVSLS